MDFNDTPEQAEYRAEAQAWLMANAELRKPGQRSINRRVDSERGLELAKEWQAKKADAGYACQHFPSEYGGQGSMMKSILFDEEESRFNVPQSFFSIGLGMCAPVMMRYASEEQKKRHVPPMVRGDEVWCQLFSEPGAGSDLAGLRMRAERDGDDWIINGQKVWTSGAHYSDYGILVTRHDTTGSPSTRGLTFFFLDMKSPGVEVRPIKQISGASDFNEVYFTNVRIPDSQRLGEVGEGWGVSITTLMNERLAVGGAPPPDANHLLDLAKKLDAQGLPGIADSAVRERIAEWHVEQQGLKLIRARTRTALSKGQTPGPESSIAKVVNAIKQQNIGSYGADLLDVAGMILDPDQAEADALFQSGFLYAPGLRIAGGTDEILRNVIAERVLQLPGDIRVDRDVPFQDIPSGS